MKPLSVIDGMSPNVGGNGENLQGFLLPIDCPWIHERIGKENIVRQEGGLTVTRGRRFLTKDGAVVGMRYLWSEDGQFVGAVNVTHLKRERERVAVISNIFVRRDWRGRGIASRLMDFVLADSPKAVVDSSLTEAGARFFGHLPGPDPDRPQSRPRP